MERLVGRLGIDVDQEVSFVSGYEVVRRLPVGVVGSLQNSFHAWNQDLLAAPCILDVDLRPDAVYVAVCDEPVWAAYERSRDYVVVPHSIQTTPE